MKKLIALAFLALSVASCASTGYDFDDAPETGMRWHSDRHH